ncbi:tyrosine-type recombinase/integrase, partial [Azoarcus indigens]|nr:tyrosine-type recombinase/integrase [Azoarcus indigens]
LHLITERKLAYASVNQAACAIRFLLATVLGRAEVAFEIPMAKVPKRLPQVLTREEVARLFACSRSLRSRTLLMTKYAAGLRLSEVCAPRLLEGLRLYWRATRPRDFLFPNAAGDGPLSEATAQRMYHGARMAAGIEHRGGIHTLRHSFATHL